MGVVYLLVCHGLKIRGAVVLECKQRGEEDLIPGRAMTDQKVRKGLEYHTAKARRVRSKMLVEKKSLILSFI
jgi:hypothetical protein